MPLILNGSTGISGTDGSAGTPAVQGTDANTGMYFPAADQIAFAEGGVEAMRLDASGNVGIGTTTPAARLDVSASSQPVIRLTSTQDFVGGGAADPFGSLQFFTTDPSGVGARVVGNVQTIADTSSAAPGGVMVFSTAAINAAATERARINSSGGFLIGKTAEDNTTVGVRFQGDGYAAFVRNSANMLINRKTSDGTLIDFQQDNFTEGSIDVNGTTVSYNGGHLSRWSQLPTNQRDPALLKGTVLSNLDEMCEWLDAEGNPLPNEQLNRMKISDVEGDPNVAGVFVNWDNDDQANPYDMNIAMTGDMIIRIGAGVVVQKGDLLMSAGDGTAKPQGDDIRRSKTVAKVTSNHVTCTYDDGSYCVPCVLMAC